jgi:DNA-binding transcriptional MerR regulator
MEKLMTVNQVLRELRVTNTTLRDWDRRGILPAQRNHYGWRLYKFIDVMKIKPKIRQGRADGKKLIRSQII